MPSALDERIHVAVRSYKRAGEVTTLDLFPFAHVWVPESQADAYRQHYGDRVVVIPDEADGNPARKFNAILDRRPAPWVLILDADISGIGHFEAGGLRRLPPDDLARFIRHGFELAEAVGARLWGLNLNPDPMSYRTQAPFNLLSPILGPFSGHLEHQLRYDESMPAREDVDHFLQHIRTFRKALRFNAYHYYHNHGSKKGGFVSMRSLAIEERSQAALIAKWGSAVCRIGSTAGGKSATGRNILNTQVRVPIPGC